MECDQDKGKSRCKEDVGPADGEQEAQMETEQAVEEGLSEKRRKNSVMKTRDTGMSGSRRFGTMFLKLGKAEEELFGMK